MRYGMPNQHEASKFQWPAQIELMFTTDTRKFTWCISRGNFCIMETITIFSTIETFVLEFIF
jgi:hypothetical protein